MTIGKSELLRLTAGKAVANTSLRWIPFFLPTLAIAFDSSTATLAVLLGIAEAGGLSTLIAGRWLDAEKERLVIIVALLGIAVASIVAIGRISVRVWRDGSASRRWCWLCDRWWTCLDLGSGSI